MMACGDSECSGPPSVADSAEPRPDDEEAQEEDEDEVEVEGGGGVAPGSKCVLVLVDALMMGVEVVEEEATVMGALVGIGVDAVVAVVGSGLPPAGDRGGRCSGCC